MEPRPWHRFPHCSAGSSGTRLKFMLYRRKLHYCRWKPLFHRGGEEISNNSSNLTLQPSWRGRWGGGTIPQAVTLRRVCFCRLLFGKPQSWLSSVHMKISNSGSFVVVEPDKLRNVKPRFQNQTASKCFLRVCNLEALSLETNDEAPARWGGSEAKGLCLAKGTWRTSWGVTQDFSACR